MFITGGIMWVIVFFVVRPSPQYAITAAHLDRESYNRIVNSSHNKAAGIGFVSAFTKENTDEDIVDVFTAPTSMTSDGDENLTGGPAVGAEILPMQASSDYNANTFVDTATHMPEDTRIVREFTDANVYARKDYVNRASNVLTRRRRALTFTDPSTLLLIFGLGTPLQLDSESVIIGLFTKMIYTLPTNSTDFTEPGTYFGRTKSRWSIYKVLERAAELYGFGAGKGCMLRAICEVAATPFNLHHGLFGEMVQAFLSPSSTNETYDEYSDQEYHASERLVRRLDYVLIITSRLRPFERALCVLIDKAMSSIQFWLSFLILSGSMCLIVHGSRVKNITSAVTRQIRSVGFPGGSGMGIFFAISIPLDIPNKAVSLSFYFEANYQLPGDKNSSNFGDYFGERSLDRKLAYQIVENNLERAGYPGRVCLMRAICEAAKNPITNNGLIGDLLHIILTPSSSKKENIAHDILQAEYEKDCDNRFGGCPVNVLDLISHYI